MKSYDILADYYDELILLEEGIDDWVQFTMDHNAGKKVLELACGSGVITRRLKDKGFLIKASDLSERML